MVLSDAEKILRDVILLVIAGERHVPTLIHSVKSIDGFSSSLFLQAYNGSLDACLKLHNKAIPEYSEWIIRHSDAMIVNQDTGMTIEHFHDVPTRAWIICILKALLDRMDVTWITDCAGNGCEGCDVCRYLSDEEHGGQIGVNYDGNPEVAEYINKNYN